MRKFGAMLMLIAMAVPVFAAGEDNVVYVNGTTAQIKEGGAGRFDFSSATQLRFTGPGGTVEIPYDGIESFEHTRQLAVHGVLPVIAVALVAPLNHNHFVRITYKDSNRVAQVAVFQVPRNMPAFLMAILEARAPRANCKPYEACTVKPRPAAPRPEPQSGATTVTVPADPAPSK